MKYSDLVHRIAGRVEASKAHAAFSSRHEDEAKAIKIAMLR